MQSFENLNVWMPSENSGETCKCQRAAILSAFNGWRVKKKIKKIKDIYVLYRLVKFVAQCLLDGRGTYMTGEPHVPGKTH